MRRRHTGHVEAQRGIEIHKHDDDLGIQRRVRGPQHLRTDLVELAQTPLLHALAAKHGRRVPHLHRGAALGHKGILHGRTHKASGTLGTQGEPLGRFEAFLGTTLKHVGKVRTRENPEHLFAHHVGGLADTVHEHIHLFHGGRLDGVEAIAGEDAASDSLHGLPGAHTGAKEILGSFWLFGLHEPSWRQNVSVAVKSSFLHLGPRGARKPLKASRLFTLVACLDIPGVSWSILRPLPLTRLLC